MSASNLIAALNRRSDQARTAPPSVWGGVARGAVSGLGTLAGAYLTKTLNDKKQAREDQLRDDQRTYDEGRLVDDRAYGEGRQYEQRQYAETQAEADRGRQRVEAAARGEAFGVKMPEGITSPDAASDVATALYAQNRQGQASKAAASYLQPTPAMPLMNPLGVPGVPQQIPGAPASSRSVAARFAQSKEPNSEALRLALGAVAPGEQMDVKQQTSAAGVEKARIRADSVTQRETLRQKFQSEQQATRLAAEAAEQAANRMIQSRSLDIRERATAMSEARQSASTAISGIDAQLKNLGTMAREISKMARQAIAEEDEQAAQDAIEKLTDVQQKMSGLQDQLGKLQSLMSENAMNPETPTQGGAPAPAPAPTQAPAPAPAPTPKQGPRWDAFE